MSESVYQPEKGRTLSDEQTGVVERGKCRNRAGFTRRCRSYDRAKWKT